MLGLGEQGEAAAGGFLVGGGVLLSPTITDAAEIKTDVEEAGGCTRYQAWSWKAGREMKPGDEAEHRSWMGQATTAKT